MSLNSDEDLDALGDLARRDPEQAAKLLYIDGLLWEASRGTSKRRRWWPWMMTAAAAAVMVLLLWPRALTLESSTGTVAFDGDRIQTGERSAAVLVYKDGSRLEVGGETEVQELNRGRVTIAKGTLRATVARQPSPLVFATPHGEARVLGTVLRLVVGRETRLEVEEGKVELRAAGSVIVTAGRYALASELVSRPLRSAAAELVAKAPAGSWVRVPGTALRSVSPDPIRFPKIQGGTGAMGVMDSWSGGVFDSRRERLVVWGGGHSNYWGNEVYAFDVAELRWLRLTEPTAEAAMERDAGPDGRPTSRSTYGGLAYLAHSDQMFAQGGCLAGAGIGRCDRTWLFDFGAGAWSGRALSPTPGGGFGCTAAYDPATRKVWWGSAETSFSGLWSWDGAAWTKHNQDNFSEHAAAVDTKRGRLMLVGQGEVFSYELRGGPLARQLWSTTGGEAFVARSAMGFEYVAPLDRFFGWHGGAVYELKPETKVWTAIDAPGAPETSRNGVFGRWRWVPSLGAFIVATHVDGDVHFFKP